MTKAESSASFGFANGLGKGRAAAQFQDASDAQLSARRRPTSAEQQAPTTLAAGKSRTHRSPSYSTPNGVRIRSDTVSSNNGNGRGGRRPPRNVLESAGRLKRLHERIESASQRAQIRTQRAFRRHGRRIARHPVQTLLIACLIITSLFYPAVGIYLWSSKGGPGVTRGDTRSVWRSLSTPLLDSFASSGRKHHNSLRDLRMIWDDAPDLRAIDARDADAYVGSVGQWSHLQNVEVPATGTKDAVQRGRTIRVEHVFVTTDDVIMGMGPRFGALHGPILLSALNLQRSIEAIIGSPRGQETGLPACIRDPTSGQCLVLSPLSYWSPDREVVKGDVTPTDTLLKSQLNYTEQGIPLTLSTTLAGRSHLFKQLPRADHLALTFFLEDVESNGRSNSPNPTHEAWSAMLRNITGQHVNLLGSDWQTPKELILQFTPRHPEESFPTQKVFLLVAYIAMIVWLTRSLSSILNVHSPFGLAFTACVELAISMTLAVSICALVGVRLTLIPWEILPFVIVVIGSENMFALTNAIISTPTSLNVASRLATGFEKAAVPIAITVASDVFLMSVIAFVVDVRAVREFCIFAIFALVVDFFMQMSFYATVLSIDIQRLELADLLSQDHQREARMYNRGGGGGGGHRDDDSNHSEGASETGAANHSRNKATSFIATSCRAAWRARTARTASLSLLLAFMAGIYLYHGTGYTSSLSFPLAVQERERAAWRLPRPQTELQTQAQAEQAGYENFDPYAHLTAGGSQDAQQPWWHDSPSARLWRLLNPQDSATLSVKVEPWTVVALPSATRQHVGKGRNFASWAIFRPRVRALIWFSKLVVLPIAGTTALLWVLLLYLLKDTELLGSQQGRSAIEEEDEAQDLSMEAKQDRSNLGRHIDVSLTVCGEGHDSDVMMSAQMGEYIVSVSAEASLHIVRMQRKTIKTDVIKIKDVVRPYSMPSAIALDVQADCVALGLQDGTTAIFQLTTPQLVRTVPSADGAATAVRLIRIVRGEDATGRRSDVHVLSIHANGTISRWLYNSTAPAQLYREAGTGGAWTGLCISRGAEACADSILMTSASGDFALLHVGGMDSCPKTLLKGKCKDGIIRSAAFLSRARVDTHLIVGTHLGVATILQLGTCQEAGRLITASAGSAIHSIKVVAHGEGREPDQDAPFFVLASSVAKSCLIGIAKGRSDQEPLPPGSPPPRRAVLQSSNSAVEDFDADSVANGNGSHSPTAPASETFKLTVLIAVDTVRGGADVVRSAGGYHLIGLRRRIADLVAVRSASADDAGSRWEIFTLPLSDFLREHRQTTEEQGRTWITRAALPLETMEVRSSQATAEIGRGASSSHDWRTGYSNGSPSPSTHISTVLAFSRISTVRAYRSGGEEVHKSAVLITFGNVIAITQVRTDKNR